MRDLRRFWRNVRNFLSSFLRFITICRSLGRLKSLKLCFPQWHIDTCYRNFNRSTTRPIVMNRRNVCHWRVVERFWTMLNDFERSILHGISPLNDRERSKTTKTCQFLENLKNFGSAQFFRDWGWTMKTVQFERFERIERFEQSSRLVDCFRRTEVLVPHVGARIWISKPVITVPHSVGSWLTPGHRTSVLLFNNRPRLQSPRNPSSQTFLNRPKPRSTYWAPGESPVPFIYFFFW